MGGFVSEGLVVERCSERVHAHFSLATVSTGAGIFSEDSGAKIQFRGVNTITSVDEPLKHRTLPFGRLNIVRLKKLFSLPKDSTSTQLNEEATVKARCGF